MEMVFNFDGRFVLDRKRCFMQVVTNVIVARGCAFLVVIWETFGDLLGLWVLCWILWILLRPWGYTWGASGGCLGSALEGPYGNLGRGFWRPF